MSEEIHENRSPIARRRAQSARLERSVNACQRCRGRKQKCDLQYPKCSSCVRTGSRCLIYDSSKGAEIPRDYVQGLESELRRLKKELEEVQGGKHSQTDIDISGVDDHSQYTRETSHTSGQISQDDTELVVSMAHVALGGINEPQFMGTSSGVTLAKLVMAAIELPHPASGTDVQMEPPIQLATAPSSLPPRHAADHLVNIYFQYRTPFFTFLSRNDTEASLQYVYGVSVNSPTYDQEKMSRELFLVYMVLAIGLIIGLKSHTSSMQQSEGCFSSALKYIGNVLAYRKSNLETLRSVLLLAQYVMMCPSKGSLWQLTGVALRLCIDLGLHWEGSSVVRDDPVTVDTRRRYFWTTYKIDRLLCIALGRPFGIVDQSIQVALPTGIHEPSDMFSTLQERVSNHLTRVFQLESEIKHVLYHQCKPPSLAFPQPVYETWYPDIIRRLEEWVAEIPSERHIEYQTAAWWNNLHSNALLLLHRPSPLIPRPSTDSLVICAFAARKQILSIRDIYREGRIDVPWIWVHRLFLAGLTTTYCLWNSDEVRQQTRFEDLMETSQACSGTLSALAERFPGAAGCRDSFDRLSAATLKQFTSNDDVLMQSGSIQFHNSAGTSRAGFRDNQRVDIGRKLPVPVSHSQPGISPARQSQQSNRRSSALDGWQPSDVFPFDGLELGESLSSAAQWPNHSAQGSFQRQ